MGDSLTDVRSSRIHVLKESGLPIPNLVEWHVIDEIVRCRIQNHDLLFHRHGRVLRLLHNSGHAVAAVELGPGSEVQIGTQLGERFHSRNGQIETKLARHFFMALVWRRHRRDETESRRSWRANAGKEQVALQVDLPIRDRNHVGRNVR